MLWPASKCQFGYANQGETRKFHRKQALLPTLLGKTIGKTAEQTKTYADFYNAVKSLKRPPDFHHLTPWAKVAALAQTRADPAQILDMLALGADLNIIRAVKKSLPSARSGVRSYLKFGTLLNRPAPPPTAETVQLRIATFNPGKTFSR